MKEGNSVSEIESEHVCSDGIDERYHTAVIEGLGHVLRGVERSQRFITLQLETAMFMALDAGVGKPEIVRAVVPAMARSTVYRKLQEMTEIKNEKS